MPIGWIDFSKSERGKILSVLDLLTEKGTLDELGIAPIRDGFSNLFFPGTSTIQTRAKYFFIVPYALKDLELSAETDYRRLLKLLVGIERMCGEKFWNQNSNEAGIIGKNAIMQGGWVQRNPSDIYWAGIRRYGIFTGSNMSLSEYLRNSCIQKKQKTELKKLGNRNDTNEEYESDDKNAGDFFKIQFLKTPFYKPEWFEDLSISLTKEEGEFLKEQIILTCPDSLIAYILKNNLKEILDCVSFQDFGRLIYNFPEEIRENYSLAIEFSGFNRVLNVIYNKMISDGQNTSANEELEILINEMPSRADIDIDYIMESLGIVKPDLKNFLKQAQEYMRLQDVTGIERLIKAREIQLKGANRAKTNHPGEFKSEAWAGRLELDYRFSNAKLIIKDIFESEGDLNA